MKTKKTTCNWVALIKAENKIYLVMTEDTPHQILGFKSLEEGRNYFTGSYNRNHDRGYEASMSACMHFIEWQPRIIKSPSIAFLKSKVIKMPPECVSLRSVSGGFTALKTRPTAKAIYDKAHSPALITPKEI